MDEQVEQEFTEKRFDEASSEEGKYQMTQNDEDDTALGEEINEALLEENENESAVMEPDELRPDSKAEEEEQGTDRLVQEMAGGGDHETITSLQDDTEEGFAEDDDDNGTDNFLEDHDEIEKSTVRVEEDEDDKTEETDGLSLEETPSTIDTESLNEFETEPQGCGSANELPFTSDTDSKKVFLQTDEEDETDNNYQGKEKEQENVSVVQGEVNETMDESQKSETSTLVEDNALETADCTFYEETNQDTEEKDRNIANEEIVSDNRHGYLQSPGITRVNNSDRIENVPTYIEPKGDEENIERCDDGEGRESGFQKKHGNYNEEDTLLLPQEDESDRLEDEEEKAKMENPSSYFQIHSNGEVISRDEAQDSCSRERTAIGPHLEDDILGNEGISGGFYGDDDLSSIFSDDGRDMSNILQENSILKEAMRQLRNDNPDGFTDTVSETSDEADDFYMYPYGASGDNKLQTTKWMADKDLSDARINEMLREKRDSQAKLRQLEREKAMVERRYRQDRMERDFLEERFTLKSSQLEDEIRNLKQENQRLKRGSKQGKGTTPNAGAKNFGNTKEPGISMLNDNEDSGFPGRNGYALDIAILAKENEKLSEIIDHLQETPRDDPFNDFVDNLDKYVPKEEYVKLEKEKLKLETALREKERMLKEQERLMEETRFDLEEEIERLKDSLKKAENKNKDKAKLLSQNDIKMMEIKTKFTEKVSKLETKLEQEISKKVKLESVIVNLKKCNGSFEKEIQDMNNRVQKLQNQEVELEAKNRREIEELQERLEKATEEKNKLNRNVEALLQDLMQLKSKMVEDAEKHTREKDMLKESVENEKARIIAGHENDNRRLKAELDEERKRNDQLKRRMAEIPGETIVSVMENTTEAGIFEGFSDIEPEVLLERTVQGEQYKEPMRDNIVTDMNEGRAKSEDQLENIPTPSDDNSSDVNKLQKKLLEVTKYNSIMQRRNKEIEEENINLKEKIERVGRDVTRMRELEDKNEELQEEIARTTKKRSELQTKQDNMIEEIDDITKKLNKVEGNNAYLSDEVERLTRKIKTMEQEFADEKSKLTSSLEQEKTNAIDETERRLEEQKVRSRKLNNEIEDLQADIKTLKDAKRAAEERYVNDTRELVERHNSELANERERYRQLQDELNNNAGAVRRVTEEWEQMLRNAVSRYEDDLQKNEDERRKLADEFQRQKEAMKSQFEKEKAQLEQRVQEIERSARSSLDSEITLEKALFSYQEPQNDFLLEDAPLEGFEDDESCVNNDIADANNKIKALQTQKQKLEQKLVQMQRHHDKEKNHLSDEHRKEKQKLEEALTEDYKRRLEESKIYYEGLLNDLRQKHQEEEAELADRFKKEKSELEEKLKEDLSNNLSSRSAELENKIQDLVSQKVQEQKEIAKKMEEKCNAALSHMKYKMKEMQNERNEMERKFEKEKKVMEATMQALTKELEKAKQEKKDLKKKQKKDKTEMEEAFESEKKEMKQIWEKCKLDTINQIEEEWIEKLKTENVKSELLKEELQGHFETRIKQMKLKFKAEKAELEKRLAEATSEANCRAEAKKEIEAALEEDYRRKLQKEKENIESTLQGLRQEIARLQEHRKQLQSQMSNRESRANVSAPPSLENNAQVLAKLDNEYQEQLKREKEYHEGRMKEMEEEIGKLHDDLSQMKTKARQEKSRVKAEFEREREEMEEQFEKERNEWRTRTNFIAMMQPRELHAQRRSAHFERRSRDLRERELHYSERHTPRMHYAGETLGPQRYEGLSSTGEL